MLSISNVSSGQAGSYYSKDDYYQTEVGVWQGDMLEGLGIEPGNVQRDDFQDIVLEKGRIQGHTFTFAPPKEVARDLSSRGALDSLREAHREAASAVGDYMSRNHVGDVAKYTQADLSRGGYFRSEITTYNKRYMGEDGRERFEDCTRPVGSRYAMADLYRDTLYRELAKRGIDTSQYHLQAKVATVKERCIPRVAYDLTFSAPKSVSMLHTVNNEVRAQIESAHSRAVEAALHHAEGLIRARIKDKEGNIRVEQTGNMACAKFTHHVSRNQDPQLHTHCVIINKTKCADGKIRAIEPSELYRQKMIMGQYYRNELSRELQKKGYEVHVTDRAKGLFEVAGFSRENIEAFSSRRAEIVQMLKDQGRELSPENCSQAVLLTRQAKKDESLDVLMQSWRLSMAEQNIRPDLTRCYHYLATNQEENIKVFNDAASNLSKRTFAFSDREMTLAALQRGVDRGITIEDLQHCKTLAQNQGDIIKLGTVNGETYYTTPEAYRREQEICRNVERGRGQAEGIDRPAVDAALSNGTTLPGGHVIHLRDEQFEAVRRITASQDRYFGVQGLAGTGKTTMLNQVREIFEAQGYKVKGVCFTGKAAEGLEKEAAIKSGTIHSHLNALEREAGRAMPGEDYAAKDTWRLAGLRPVTKELWVVDEAGMTDNNLLHHLVEAAERRGARVVMVGDYRQLPPIGAGDTWGAMIRHDVLDHVELSDIRRQRNDVLREAVRFSAGASAGDVAKAFERLDNNDSLIEIEDKRDRLSAVASAYAGQSEAERSNSVILTASNADRQALNALVRTELKATGYLRAGITVDIQSGRGRRELELSAGDRIIFLQNNRELGVKNGQTGIMRGVQEGRLQVETGGRLVQVDPYAYNKIDHAYAMTVHKAQGATYDRVYINAGVDARWANNRNAFYVEISRARNEALIYTDDIREFKRQSETDATKFSSLDFHNEALKRLGSGDPPAYVERRATLPPLPTEPLPPLALEASRFRLDQAIRMSFSNAEARQIVRSAEKDRGID